MSHSVLITFSLMSFPLYFPLDFMSFQHFYTIQHFFVHLFIPFRCFVRQRFILLTFLYRRIDTELMKIDPLQRVFIQGISYKGIAKVLIAKVLKCLD